MATLGQHVLERVVAKYGAVQAAVRLGIADPLLRHMLSGLFPVPDSVLLKAVDVLDETPAPAVDPKSLQGPTAV
jgi:hypothetical protein